MANSNLPQEWRLFKLGDLGRIVTGKTPSTKVPEYFGKEVPFVTPRDMDGRKTISTTERYLSKVGFEAVRNCRIPSGSVMVSCIGSDMGKVAIAGRDCVTNQQINSIFVDEQWSAGYVYYNLSMRKDEFQNLAGGGSAQPRLNKGHFSQVSIPMPTYKEQQAIAYILGTLDDKIELNRKMNETLEAIARAIFKSWFVDFDPVRAKMEGSQPFGMDRETAELFSDSFEDSLLGEIPRGWKVAKLGDLIDIKHGFAFKGDYFSNEPEGDILLTPGNFAIGGGFKDDKFKYYVGPVTETFVLEEGDLIITMTDLSKMGDTLGYPAILPPSPVGRFLHNQRLGKVFLKNERLLGKMLLYCILCSETYRHHVLSTATGTTVRHTSPDKIKSHDIVLPREKICTQFERIVGLLRKKVVSNSEQSRNLATLRDALLPKLVSGQMRIKDPEKFVSALTRSKEEY